MSALTPAVSAWLSGHHGVAQRNDLLRLGLTEGQINSLLRARVLVPYTHRVYRLAGAPETAEQAMALACSVAPDVVVSFGSAARLWGMRRVGNDGVLHVTIAGRAHRSIPDTVVHRSHRIDLVDVVDRTDGIRVTSPPRTVFDLWPSSPTSGSTRSSSSSSTATPAPCPRSWRPAADSASGAGPDRRASRGCCRSGPTGSSRSAPTSSSAWSVPCLRPAFPDRERQAEVRLREGSSSTLTSCGVQRARRSRSTTSPSTAASSTSTTTSGEIANYVSWASM